MKDGRQAERAQRAEQRDVNRRQRAATYQLTWYWQSPAGQARQAYEQGDTLFELVATPFSLLGNVSSIFGTFSNKKTFGVVGNLTAIERAGWRLEHAGYAFAATGAVSRDKLFTSRQQYATSGDVVGFYLFRRVEEGVRQVAPLDVLAAVNEMEKITGQQSVRFPEMRDPDIRAAFDAAEAEADGDLLEMDEEGEEPAGSALPPPPGAPLPPPPGAPPSEA